MAQPEIEDRFNNSFWIRHSRKLCQFDTKKEIADVMWYTRHVGAGTMVFLFTLIMLSYVWYP